MAVQKNLERTITLTPVVLTVRTLRPFSLPNKTAGESATKNGGSAGRNSRASAMPHPLRHAKRDSHRPDAPFPSVGKESRAFYSQSLSFVAQRMLREALARV